MNKIFYKFQKPSTEIMEEIIELYDFVMFNMYILFAIVIFLLIWIIYRFRESRNPIPRNFSSNIWLEIFWTLGSFLILIIIAIPSIRLTRKINTIPESEFSIKVIGYQWYWKYKYIDHQNIEFDSFIDDKGPRLLSVDNKLLIPENTVVRLILTSGDVIHSFFLPSAGIKVDCIPGKINETWIKIKHQGTYYGQCAELCGQKHAFMPIVVEVVSKEEFDKWVEEKLKN